MRSTSPVWFVGKDRSCIRRGWSWRLHSYRLHKDDSLRRIAALLVCDTPASPRGRASDRASDDRGAVGFSGSSRNRRCYLKLRSFSGLRFKSTSSDPARPLGATLKQIVCRQFSTLTAGSANMCLSARSLAPDPSRLISVAGSLFLDVAVGAFPKTAARCAGSASLEMSRPRFGSRPSLLDFHNSRAAGRPPQALGYRDARQFRALQCRPAPYSSVLSLN